MRTDLSDTARGFVQDIRHAGNNLISIINDILDFSKIEAGKMEIFPVEYLLSSLVNGINNLIKIRVEEKPIQFNMNIDDNIPNCLIGDAARIRQILLNLLTNAVKYTEKGQITFSINIDKKDDKQIRLKIDVSDTGIGIKPEDHDRLFDDFVRVNAVQNQSIEGTGLGLAIAKRLCIAMGGDISVISEYGKGTTFTVIIPQGIGSEEKYSSSAEIENNYNSVENIKFISPDARILIVDDILTNLKVAEGLLSFYQAKVESCLSGVKAIELVKQKHYDLVFMDHMMPEMDGIEAISRIRAWEKEQGRGSLPVIALTANAFVGMKEMFESSGFDDFLSKPIDVFKLDDILDKWLPDNKKKAITKNKDKKKKTNGFIPEIPGVNVKQGIINTGGTFEMYCYVLSVFCADIEDKIALIKPLHDGSIQKDFTIHVHALKSALAALGAKDVSAKAAKLETAGNEGNLDFINKNISEFIEQLITVKNNFLAALEYNKTNGDNTGISKDKTLLPLFNDLANALKAKNASEIDRLSEEIQDKEMDSETKKTVEQIFSEILMTEYENALQIVNKLLNDG